VLCIDASVYCAARALTCSSTVCESLKHLKAVSAAIMHGAIIHNCAYVYIATQIRANRYRAVLSCLTCAVSTQAKPEHRSFGRAKPKASTSNSSWFSSFISLWGD
jgi:hypothetical protein